LSLPIFNGDVVRLACFLDSYEVAVHKNAALSKVEKFTYLQSLVLKGAKTHYIRIGSYCRKLWREHIISKHMEVLLSIESVTWQGNTHSLWALYDKVETHLRALKALGVPAEAYISLLPSLILKKLPQELCLAISRKLKYVDWKLDEMRELGEELYTA
uniref:Uncharacterized protein n=1 Tax=Amphimedon queenslandica TaxID=400682 RepID=A0A1X7TPL8_AMPQE